MYSFEPAFGNGFAAVAFRRFACASSWFTDAFEIVWLPTAAATDAGSGFELPLLFVPLSPCPPPQPAATSRSAATAADERERSDLIWSDCRPASNGPAAAQDISGLD